MTFPEKQILRSLFFIPYSLYKNAKQISSGSQLRVGNYTHIPKQSTNNNKYATEIDITCFYVLSFLLLTGIKSCIWVISIFDVKSLTWSCITYLTIKAKSKSKRKTVLKRGNLCQQKFIKDSETINKNFVKSKTCTYFTFFGSSENITDIK